MNVANLNANACISGRDHRFTNHAATRMQQRCIPPAVVEATMRFGTKSHVRNGAVRYDLDRKALKRSRRHFGDSIARALEDYDGIYVLASDEQVIITTAHRH